MKAFRHISHRRLLAITAATALATVAGSVAATGAVTRVWSGTTARGVHVHFHTNANRSKILAGLYMAIPRVICLHNGQGAASGSFQISTSRAVTVSGGSFSTKQLGRPNQYGLYAIKMTGQFKGTDATAKVTWALKNVGRFSCTPTRGTLSWKAFLQPVGRH